MCPNTFARHCSLISRKNKLRIDIPVLKASSKIRADPSLSQRCDDICGRKAEVSFGRNSPHDANKYAEQDMRL